MKKHAVVESKENELRRYFACKDVRKLDTREHVEMYSKTVYFNKSFVDVNGATTDSGTCDYFIFEDRVKKRSVCMLLFYACILTVLCCLIVLCLQTNLCH